MAISFNDTGTDKNGLIQVCETKLFGSNYGAISDSTKRKATFARYMNGGLNRYLALAMEYETRWQFHDSNYTTQPAAYTTLVAGQEDYGLSDLHLQIKNAYVKNQDGIKVPLKPVDEYDFSSHGVAIDEYFVGNGMPQYYDKRGRSIHLFPAPSAEETTLVAGLYLTYTSAPSYFAHDDTTKGAGIPLHFQEFPAIYASWKYAIDKVMPKKADGFKLEIMEMEQNIINFYSKRDRDDKPRMRVRKRSYV